MFKLVLMFDLIAQMVLHLLLYFLKACDKRFVKKTNEGGDLVRRTFESNTVSNSSELERYSDVFPGSFENERVNDRNRSFA